MDYSYMPEKPKKPESVDRRILVLGSANHTRLVNAYEWDNLPANLNVSDFDTLILNFAPFQDKDYPKGLNMKLMPSWRQFARLIFSKGSEVIAIGSPNFIVGGNPYLRSTWWLPIEPAFVYEMGEDIREVKADFAYYFALVRRWSFYLEGINEIGGAFEEDYLALGAPGANSIRTVISNLAETRFHRAIGFQLYFDTYRVRSSSASGQVKMSGNVYWLPEPTETSVVEGIDLILRERYSLRFEKVPPKWVETFQLPNQLPIIKEIREKEAAIAELTRQLETERRKLALVSRFSKLLYEQGEDILEPIVRDALRDLGASVEDPKQRGREDGRLVDPFGRQGMLEIKGRSGNLRLSDVRELDNWVRDAIAHETWNSKGLLIVNLQCDEDPRKRRNFVPANCAEAAKTFDISILTTTQVFHALVSDQKGELDRKVFWERVFAARGICDLPSLI
jgi:hypothetical protein